MQLEQAIQKISDALSDMLHGPRRDQFEKALSKNPTPEAVASLLYKPARQAIEEAEQRFDVDESFIFGVVTDAIDMTIEMLDAMGKMGDEEEFRDATLMAIMMIHASMSEDTPESRAEAQESMAQFAQDGTLGQVQKTMNRKSEKAGVNPQDFERIGAEMITPQQTPIAAGVRQGLGG